MKKINVEKINNTFNEWYNLGGGFYYATLKTSGFMVFFNEYGCYLGITEEGNYLNNNILDTYDDYYNLFSYEENQDYIYLIDYEGNYFQEMKSEKINRLFSNDDMKKIKKALEVYRENFIL